VTLRGRILALAFALACIGVALSLGEGYIARLSNHAGYFLVGVDDSARPPPDWRPRHTAFILVDGLRRDAAERMSVTRTLEREGQCLVSDQGSYTISRPVYTLLSGGIEVDRSGVRNNDLTTPTAADSVWQAAHDSGMRVAGSSHLPWFKQLFPQAFDRYKLHVRYTMDVFAPSVGELLDVNVFHPLYVDENGHEHGAASPEYAGAVERADREIATLLGRMDLTQDLVVMTADHGHRDVGGHGGGQPEIRDVLVCFAGKNVARKAGRGAFDGLITAPTLAVLLGVRFPRNMRAGEDDLDAIWGVVRASARPDEDAYLSDRRAAVERFREANRVALEGWLGGPPGTWSRLYAREVRAQALRALGVAGAVVLALGVELRRRRVSSRAFLRGAAFVLLCALSTWAVHRIVLGPFDYSVVNQRARFVPRAFEIAAIGVAIAVAGHRWVAGRADRRLADFSVVLVSLFAVNVGHRFVFGDPLGFPLPPPPARYFPFFGAIALATWAAAVVLIVAWDAGRWLYPRVVKASRR
jgi:hypothetical protein